MATSSRPFQSQTVARLVAGYRQVTHGTGRWLRQGRTAVVWGLQVAIYPFYAAVQGLRVGYRRLQAARPWQRVWNRLSGSRPSELVAADLPIRALLSVIQPPVLSAELVRMGGLRLVNVYGQWLQQSQAGAVLTPGQWQLVAFPASIRGIASDLADRRLVLVTVHNDIFTDLTADQQQRLQRAIVLMLAEYARQDRQLTGDRQLQQSWLPLPQPDPALLPPLRWLATTVRWMQTSPLAAATNLFGEARQPQTDGVMVRHGAGISRDRAVIPSRHSRLNPALLPGVPSPYPAPLSSSTGLATLPATASIGEAVGLAIATSAVVAPAPRVEFIGTVGAVHSLGSLETAVVEYLPATVLSGVEAQTGSHRPLPPAEAIEAQVVQVSYIDHPLVLVLRGLDWVLYAIETRLRGVWAWLRQQW